MRKNAMLLFFVVACAACVSEKQTAILTANAIYDAGTVGGEVLKIACTDRYAQAPTEDAIAALDKTCLPAATAYDVLRITHARLVAVLASGADFGTLLREAQKAAADFATTLKEVKP